MSPPPKGHLPRQLRCRGRRQRQVLLRGGGRVRHLRDGGRQVPPRHQASILREPGRLRRAKDSGRKQPCGNDKVSFVSFENVMHTVRM